MNKLPFVIFISIFLLLSCSTKNAVPEFDSSKAYQYLVDQVNFGPRVPGSEASAACRKYMVDFLVDCGLKVDSQVFMYDDAYSDDTIRMVNIIASFKGSGDSDKGIVLLAHYDSRPRTDFPSDPNKKSEAIDGANDGASGTAVLMELANLFKNSPPDENIDLAFFDGEDWGESGDMKNYLLGSRHFAQSGIRDKYRFGILLDMVGDKDLRIYKEGFSQKLAPEVNDYVFQKAKELGLQQFVDTVKYSISDDHLLLNTVGIPTIDLIDFDYPYWHTDKDSSDKCSPESLGAVGKLLTEIIYNGSL